MGTEHVHTAENIREAVEHSLRTLKTDHLDLVQFHCSLSRKEFEAQGALDELLALRDEGKVRFVGVSAVLPTLDEQLEMGVFDAFQIPYSALQRDHENSYVGPLTPGRASSFAAAWPATPPTTGKAAAITWWPTTPCATTGMRPGSTNCSTA